MRHLIGVLLVATLFVSCKKDKEPGDIKYKTVFTNIDNQSFKATTDDTLHTGFGTYITSVTPYHFTASINMLGMQDDYKNENTTIILGFIMDDGTTMIVPEPQADFSNNKELEFSPEMGHQVTPGQVIDFIYFYFSAYYIYQEVVIPTEYQNITIDQFNEVYPVGYFGIDEEQFYCDSVKFGNILKVRDQPFATRLYPYPAGYTRMFIFGNTDSTFIFNKEGNLTTNGVDNPFGGGSNSCSIRSNKYNASSITIPAEGETLTVKATVSFNTNHLIQVYTGADNIPYTSDDIFVYAPRYWERIKVKLESSLN